MTTIPRIKVGLYRRTLLALVACASCGCSTLPSGPTVIAMPGPYKPFEVFQIDEETCRRYAQGQVAGTPQTSGPVESGAVSGAVIGATAGALLGSGSRDAATGAGVGLLAGAAVGADAGNRQAGYLQYRYDVAYEQCMYAKGNQVPGFAVSVPVPPPPPPRR